MRLGHQRGRPASSAAGMVECPTCEMGVVVRALLQHVGGHIREAKVRLVCLLRTTMYPRKPTCSGLLDEAYRTASITLAMTSNCLDHSSDDKSAQLVLSFDLTPSFVRVKNQRVLHRHYRRTTHAASVVWLAWGLARHGYMCTQRGEKLLANSPAAFSLQKGTRETPRSRST